MNPKHKGLLVEAALALTVFVVVPNAIIAVVHHVRERSAAKLQPIAGVADLMRSNQASRLTVPPEVVSNFNRQWKGEDWTNGSMEPAILHAVVTNDTVWRRKGVDLALDPSKWVIVTEQSDSAWMYISGVDRNLKDRHSITNVVITVKLFPEYRVVVHDHENGSGWATITFQKN